MVKITDALVTVEDVNGMLQPIGSAPLGTNRIVVKDQNFTGASTGTVGVNNYWKVDTTVSPYSTYTNNRNPRYQDLIPLYYNCNDGIVQGGYAGTSIYTYANQGVTTYSTAISILYWEVYDRPNIISVYDSTGLRYTTGWVGYANYSGPWGPSLSTPTTGSVTVTFASTTGRYIMVQAGNADPVTPTVDSYSWSLTCITTTTTTTSTSTTTTTTTIPTTYDLYYPCGSTTPASQRLTYDGTLTAGVIILGSNRLCYTVAGTGSGIPNFTKLGEFSTCGDCAAAATTTTTTTCNPTPNWQWNGNYGCYGGCNKYEVEQDQNSCSPTFGQTRQGTVVQYDSTFCGGCCGQSTAPIWVNNGAQFCSGCTLYQPERDNNPCSPTYNNTQNTPLGTSNTCGSWNTSYYCTGCAYYSKETNSCTGDVRNVTLINGNSTSCGGCCGQSTAANWQNTGSFSCYGTCNKYNVEQDINNCSSTYGQTRQGSLDAANSSYCFVSGLNCCGQSTAPNWVNNGSTFCSSCYLFQPQIDNNTCSATYGQTQDVSLGLNSDCGGWPTTYYCVGYDYYSKETSSCTGAVRNVTLVQANSPYCGYSNCTTWDIFAYNADEYVYVDWTNCSGGSSSTSFYSGGGGICGSICVQNGTTPSITSGNGAASNTGNMCT